MSPHHRREYDDDDDYDEDDYDEPRYEEPRYEERGFRRGYDDDEDEYDGPRYEEPRRDRGFYEGDRGYEEPRYQDRGFYDGPPPFYNAPPPGPPAFMMEPRGPPGPPPPDPRFRGGPPPPAPGFPPGPPQGPPQQFQPGPMYQQMAGPPQGMGYGGNAGPRKKSLLIGINYVGSQHLLQGCHQDVTNMREFLTAMGYPQDPRSQVVMRDDQYTDPRGPMFPNGHNILAAMTWLVSEPGTCNFLHYSGHGGQVADDDGNSDMGFDDTIVPYDFQRAGQIPSGVLHRTLVSRLPPNSTLMIIFDCCHSGSAVELPYVYRADQDGNVSVMSNLQAGMKLWGQASHLLQGGSIMEAMASGEGRELFAGAQSFFKGLTHENDADEYGLGSVGNFEEEYRAEGPKAVWMYSGCRDDQTSADASIAGAHVGAMSWAFLECMKRFGVRQSYLQVLQNTRGILQGRYQQIPQLSVGYEQDLNYQIRI